MTEKRSQKQTASIAWFMCAGITAVLAAVAFFHALAFSAAGNPGGGVIPVLVWGVLTLALTAGGTIIRRLPNP